MNVSHETIAPWPLFPQTFKGGLTGVEYHNST